MAERARAVYYVLDSEGRPIPTATITLRQKGTTTNITETIYAADDPDTSQLTNGAFFSGADGKVEFYLTDPKRLDMLVTKSGYTSQTIPLDVSTISAGYTLVAEEGSNLTARTKLNFIGSGVTAADDAANGRTNVTIPGASNTVGDLLDWQFVRKTADESVTSSTTLQNDDALLFAISANQTWMFNIDVVVGSGAEAADLEFTMTAPSGAGGTWNFVGLSVATTDPTAATVRSNGGLAFATSRTVGIDDTTNTVLHISGICANGANAGNVTFQWAQSASNATATTIKADSFLLARRVV